MKYLKVILFVTVASITTISCQQEDIIESKIQFIEGSNSIVHEEDDDDIPTCGEGC